MWLDSFDRVVMKMSRWVRSGTALAVMMVLVAALAALVTIHTAGLGRADVCADADGRQFAAVGGCVDSGAAAPFALAPPENVPQPFALPLPELVPPPREYVPSLRRPENIRHPATAAAWSTTDLTQGGQLPSGIWPVFPGIAHYEVGNYMSDGLQIYGLICYPAFGSGYYPVLIINHGLNGIFTNTFNGCTQMAAEGWFVAISTYRAGPLFWTEYPGASTFPPDPTFTRQSGGQFEFCGGEVDDSLNLLAAVKNLPEANANQVLMWGHSHGSCITELAIERRAAPQIAVSLDGPSDFTGTTWQVLNAPPPSGFGAAWCDSCGTTDTEQLTARSSAWPGNTPGNLANVKFLRIHGEGDRVVIPQQGCELAAALGPGSSNYFLYPEISPPGTYVVPPKECGPWLPHPCYLDHSGSHCGPWKLGGVFPDWPHGGPWTSPTFLMYACPESVCTGSARSPTGNEGITEHGAIIDQSWSEVASFVNQFALGWSASFPTQPIPFE